MKPNNLFSFAAGVLFAIGLAISGMTDPGKVIGFLDVTGNWQPALMFVMIGAIGTHATLYRVIIKKPKPIIAGDIFATPKSTSLDKPLILGSLMFGVGWGLGGLCPGPAIASLTTGFIPILWFLMCMIVGMGAHRLVSKKS